MTQYFVICGSLVENNYFAFCNASPKKNESSLESTCDNQLSLTNEWA